MFRHGCVTRTRWSWSEADMTLRGSVWSGDTWRSHSPTVGMSACPPVTWVSRGGITPREHSKPANLENNTALIHVSIAQLNMQQTLAAHFPAVSHCIMGSVWCLRISGYRTLQLPRSAQIDVSLHLPLRSTTGWQRRLSLPDVRVDASTCGKKRQTASNYTWTHHSLCLILL